MNYSSKVIVFVFSKLSMKVHCIFLYPFLRVPYLAVARTFEKIEDDSGRYEV